MVDEELLKKIHFKLQAATYKFGGRDLENEVFRRQDGDGSGQLDFPEFVSLFRKVLRLTPQECSDIDIRTVFEYMGGSYLAGVQQERFKEFLDEDFELDFISRRLKVRVGAHIQFRTGVQVSRLCELAEFACTLALSLSLNPFRLHVWRLGSKVAHSISRRATGVWTAGVHETQS